MALPRRRLHPPETPTRAHGENEDVLRQEQVAEWRQHLFLERACVEKAAYAVCDVPAQEQT